MPDLPTGTVTLLFTDIEGSTRLLQQLGEHYADVLATCRQLLREVFQQWNGHEVDTQGDCALLSAGVERCPGGLSSAPQHHGAIITQCGSPTMATKRVCVGFLQKTAIDAHNHVRRADMDPI